jgi:hypothetical protein
VLRCPVAFSAVFLFYHHVTSGVGTQVYVV